ncbi:ABC transporter permease [Mesorhizobium sp. B2-4-13]|uniref:ABC transporter permease n=1 Tax=Mesorhizobium sp. B2-4-13 TaxID=2589936 RepID=UPI001152968D|nr:ABC transporter permease [Mesorhizobium sp. B2-4-13]TPK87030.1 ABC transporter permease [Mesorhizobium sp. B2-4-13]
MTAVKNKVLSEKVVLHRNAFAIRGGVDYRRKVYATFLIAPLFLFLVVALVIPVGGIFWYAVSNSDLNNALSKTAEALKGWGGTELPAEPAFSALADDLRMARVAGKLPELGVRLNREKAGFGSLLRRTARKLPDAEGSGKRELLVGIDARWGDIDYWRSLYGATGIATPKYLLAAVDLQRNWDGSLTRVPAEQRVFLEGFLRTLVIAFVVTCICLAVGYPLAFILSEATGVKGRVLLALVVLPLWTSVLARTAAWMVLLQQQGVVNDVLIRLGIVEQPLELIFNRTGVYIGMVHVLLPFMTLPLYGAMKGVPKNQLQAASSLGARPLTSFITVYIPQTLPGIASGTLMVFIIAIGFYITPALVGGPDDQMISGQISRFAIQSGNWGMAAALSIWLTVCILMLLLAFGRFLRLGGSIQ